MAPSAPDSGAVDDRWRRVPAVAIPAVLTALAHAVGLLVHHVAVHLCGWPATVSCDFGVPVVWQVLVGGLWVVAVVSAADALQFVATPDVRARRRMLGWSAWGAAVLLGIPVTTVDRSLELGDLVVGTVVVLCAVVLVAAAVGDRLRLRRAPLVTVFAGPAIAVLLIPAWAPPAFRATEFADPARQDDDRRRRSQECLEDQSAQGGRAPPPDAALPACEVYPPPTGSRADGERLPRPFPAP